MAYFFTVPFLWGWANFHPLTILFNLLLAPILIFIWLSFSLICFIAPSTGKVVDSALTGSLQAISYLIEPIPPAVTGPDHSGERR